MVSRFRYKSSKPEILQGQATDVGRSAAVHGTTGRAGAVYTSQECSFRIANRACAYSRRNTPVSLSEGDLLTAVGLAKEEGWFECWALRNDSTGVTYSPTIGVVRTLGYLFVGLGIVFLPVLIGIFPLGFGWLYLRSAKQNTRMMQLLERTPASAAH